MVKGLIVCVAHLLVVSSLGAKLLYDRATRPRVWTRAAPYDPDLPIRGRYVSLQIEIEARDIPAPVEPVNRERPWENRGNWERRNPVVLSVENDKLVARRDPQASEEASYNWGRDAVMFRPRADGTPVAVLANPVLYFMPEHVADPSRREAGEELWVEVTLPKKGPPRPIRLGVMKDGKITPLDLD